MDDWYLAKHLAELGIRPVDTRYKNMVNRLVEPWEVNNNVVPDTLTIAGNHIFMPI